MTKGLDAPFLFAILNTMQAIKPHTLMTATQSIEWFRANGIKGKQVSKFRNGEILVEFEFMQDFPSGAQPYTQRIRGFNSHFEGVL